MISLSNDIRILLHSYQAVKLEYDKFKSNCTASRITRFSTYSYRIGCYFEPNTILLKKKWLDWIVVCFESLDLSIVDYEKFQFDRKSILSQGVKVYGTENNASNWRIREETSTNISMRNAGPYRKCVDTLNDMDTTILRTLFH